jgi:hypothetical protein
MKNAKGEKSKDMNIYVRGKQLSSGINCSPLFRYLAVEFFRIFFTDIMNVKCNLCITTITRHHDKIRFLYDGH